MSISSDFLYAFIMRVCIKYLEVVFLVIVQAFAVSTFRLCNRIPLFHLNHTQLALVQCFHNFRLQSCITEHTTV